jgi:putative ABC transport system permease protein
MLRTLFHNQVALGFAQAGAVSLAAFVMAMVARRVGIHLVREVAVALARGLVQIVAVGSVLILLLRGPQAVGFAVLAAMTVAAAATSARRARSVPGAFRIALYSIAAGAGTVILAMTWLGVIETRIAFLVPVGSMLVANAMNATSLALNRFRAEVDAHAGLVETALALGAEAPASVRPYAESALRSSLIPAVDSLRALGVVWIPGLMAGMVLSGSDPLYAAVYQFVTIAMIFCSSGLTCLMATTLARTAVFSPAGQLLLARRLDAAV